MSDVIIENLTKRYDETTAVDDVSLTVADGETLGVVGPSGCGKTTTLRSVAGFETPTEGRIRFGDEDITHVPPESRNVGLVFQSYALFDNMTVRENVGFGPKMQGVSAAERDRRTDRLLELLGIDGFGDRDPTTLSGGQQQRVGLARALAIEPEILLLDEPMTGLDAKLKRRLRTEVGDLLDDLDVTALYVTHDQEEAMEMCDRIAVMNDGVLEQVGTPQEVYRSPANEFVADFIGTSNFLSGEATGNAIDLGFTTVATNGATPTPGSEATITIRPEAFTVGEGSIDATVIDRAYLGETIRVRAELPDGQEITLSLDENAPEPGESTTLSIDETRMHLLEA
jgi:putative spermidine/putrescine transport system ATP-binding protein